MDNIVPVEMLVLPFFDEYPKSVWLSHYHEQVILSHNDDNIYDMTNVRMVFGVLWSSGEYDVKVRYTLQLNVI